MREVVMHTAGDVRFEDRGDLKIIDPADVVIRLTTTCARGSGLWPHRGFEPADHTLMGHEHVGVVEEVGSEVTTVQPGDLVVGSFIISDNTSEIRRPGYRCDCAHLEFVAGPIGTKADEARIPYADGTLVATGRSAGRGADHLTAGHFRCARHRLVRRRATKVLLHP